MLADNLCNARDNGLWRCWHCLQQCHYTLAFEVALFQSAINPIHFARLQHDFCQRCSTLCCTFGANKQILLKLGNKVESCDTSFPTLPNRRKMCSIASFFLSKVEQSMLHICRKFCRNRANGLWFMALWKASIWRNYKGNRLFKITSLLWLSFPYLHFSNRHHSVNIQGIGKKAIWIYQKLKELSNGV